MPVLLIDSHCHLDFPDFREECDQVVTRAQTEGVRVMQTICTRVTQFPQVLAVAERYEHVLCSVGIHPNHTHEEPRITAAELVRLAEHPKVIGLGETGLDYYYQYAPHDLQRASFLEHIAASRITGLPVIIHTRAADDDTIAILREEQQKGAFPALIHCFSTDRKLAEAAVEMGMYVSLSGILTFKKSTDLQTIAKDLPLESLLVETDAPYLAPMPMRGKRNEPAFTRHTAQFLADLKGIPYEEVAEVTTRNFFRLFAKAERYFQGKQL